MLDLPVRIRILFIIAGSIYVMGAMGLELVGGYHADTYGVRNTTYVVLVSIEEILEMIGVVIFIYALMSYISSMLPGLNLRISSDLKPNQ